MTEDNTPETPMADDKNNQTPLEKFQRLATARSGDAAKKFKLLRNLASSAYQIDSKLAQEIVNNLAKELEDLKIKWKLIENPNKKARKKSVVSTTVKEETTEDDTSEDPTEELLASMADVE